jgi:uncharacterized OB-fold protein
MSMAPRPLPGDVTADALDQPFWDACAEHRFLVHRCRVCGRSYWPASCCVDHGSTTMEWVEASGRARLYTYVIIHHVFGTAFRPMPYNVSVVQLEEGPFFHTNVVGCDDDALVVGMDLEVAFEDQPEGFTLPLFRPAGSS